METQKSLPCYCFRLRRAGGKLTEKYNASLAECGLTVSQFALLTNIYQNQPVSTSKLAEIMSLDRTTLVRNLKSLEKAEYITFAKGSGRERPLSLTEAGEKKRADGMILWQKAQKEVEKALGPRQMEHFKEILAAIEKM
ncbi:MAG: MarR family winged helix-turn-helix transcriptional regulator [Clostridia bacterium]